SPKNYELDVMGDKILGLLVVCHPHQLLARIPGCRMIAPIASKRWRVHLGYVFEATKTLRERP
ncbi:MAG TPA: hypothetical protein VE056_08275, partial [Pyrinomonadaceae bacterium]|nr:hypothetical protein [Pyrinomonadaceae bacterium]